MIRKDETKSVVAKNEFSYKQLVISLGILILGILITVVLIKLRKPPERIEKENLAPLVKVEQLKAEDVQMVVSGYGTVSAKVEVEIVPQVSGKVVAVNPEFKAGGFIAADEQLLEIDPRDYELVVQQAQAVVAEAMVTLDLEKAEAQVAKKEWEQLNPNTEPSSPLVLREPQIRQAEAKLESAKAHLAIAKLNLERTKLSLPIDARIVSERVDLGQYVVTGQSLGVAYGTDSVEIYLPLEDRELEWFDIPDGRTKSAEKVTAEVKANFAGAEHSWTGYVKRTTGQIDKMSRLVSVVIEVAKPFDSSDSKPPLVPGMFVNVFIKGKILENAIAIPRTAIRNSNEVWVIEDEQLHIQSLEIVRFDENYGYAVSGLDDGVVIVVSSLDAVVEGMKIRRQRPDDKGQEIEEVSEDIEL